MGNVTAEMIQPVEGMGPHMEFLKSRSVGGAHHVGFLVDNIAQERAKLVENGVPIVLIRKTEASPFTYFDTAKVGNVQIELVQWDLMRIPRSAGPGQ